RYAPDSGQSPQKLVESALLFGEVGRTSFIPQFTGAATDAGIAAPQLGEDQLAQLVGLVLSPRALRLGVRLEGLPDHGSARLVCRPAVEHALAAAPVDAHHAHTRRREERPSVPLFARVLHELLEDRCRHAPALRPTAKAAGLVIADVDAAYDIGRATYEPHVGRPARRAGLAEQRHVEIAQHRRRAALDDAFEHMRDLVRGSRVEDLLALLLQPRHRLAVPFGHAAAGAGARIGAPDDLAAAVLDVIDHGRIVLDAVVRQRRIGVDHLQDRGLARA